MTEEEETKVKDLLAHLFNGFQEMQTGVKLMTDVLVKLERRVADLENIETPKSRIIVPTHREH